MRTLVTAGLGLAMLVGVGAEADAALLVQPLATGTEIVHVYGGCGPTGHRGPYGGCRPGGQWGGYVRGRACPRGFHLGPYGRACRRNFF